MKKHNILLSVPTPCHAPWEDMTPNEKGRFCQSCQTPVVDFSGMSDKQIIDFFANYPGKHCGRYHPSQLNTTLYSPVPIKRMGIRTAFVAGITGVMALFTQQARAEKKVQTAIIQLPVMPAATAEVPADTTIDSSVYIIKGRVWGRNDNGKKDALPFVTIQYGESRGVVSDKDGYFSISLPKSDYGREIRLIFNCVGFKTSALNVKLNDKSLQKELKIVMETNVMGLTAMIYVDSKGRPIGSDPNTSFLSDFGNRLRRLFDI